MKPNPEARALNAIFRDLMETRDGATFVAGRVWGVNTHYDLGSDQPMVGYSVPNFAFEDGTTMSGHMHDGLGVLLDFDSDASLKTLADAYGERLKYISGRVRDQLGLSALLIRPDGYIAWASDAHADTTSIRQAADRWFARKETS